MSHGIGHLDQIVLGSNTPAWHSIGRVFPGLLSPLRVYAEGVGARDIIERPVAADGMTMPGAKALIAITTSGERAPLSVVSET